MSRAQRTASSCAGRTVATPRLGTWVVILLVALLPVALALLAPPPLGADGPSLSSAPRDVSAAAMDRMQRALTGALDVALDAPRCTGLALACVVAAPERHPAAAPAVALATDTVRTL
jgi:hypothetical protein